MSESKVTNLKNIEKPKQIVITVGGNKYTLEFDRKTAAITESNGFDATQLGGKPNVMVPLIVRGAFTKHHKYMRQDAVMDIWELCDNKSDLLSAITEMYADTFTSMLGAEDKDVKNPNWELSW